MDKNKLTFIAIVIAAFVALIVACILLIKSNIAYRDKYKDSVANEKSLIQQLEGATNENIAYKSTIDDLRHINDSMVQCLLNARQQVSAKDKEIEYMLHHQSIAVVTDTVVLTDTIFRDKDYSLDTLMEDEWHSTRITLKYPSYIEATTSVLSVKDVFIYHSRETVEPPKKFFLCRWFQKKHTVYKVYVEEQNPMILSQKTLFVKTEE